VRPIYSEDGSNWFLCNSSRPTYPINYTVSQLRGQLLQKDRCGLKHDLVMVISHRQEVIFKILGYQNFKRI
jgi:hypothetical protein